MRYWEDVPDGEDFQTALVEEGSPVNLLDI
jgi:hypothetical protein